MRHPRGNDLGKAASLGAEYSSGCMAVLLGAIDRSYTHASMPLDEEAIALSTYPAFIHMDEQPACSSSR